MKTTTLDQAITGLDFAPACNLPECAAGNPAATHTLNLSFTCGDARTFLICTTCVAAIRRAASVPGVVATCYQHHVDAPASDAVRIEPLP